MEVVPFVTFGMRINPEQGRKLAASRHDPQFIVETEQGKRAAHKPGALTRG